MAWKAILQRGSQSQKIRKVKGHATDEDIKQGRSAKQDQNGNDKADKNADIGVEMVHGTGFVRLGQWLAERHNRYINFMGRIQKMIAAVTLAEKEARKKPLSATKRYLATTPPSGRKPTPSSGVTTNRSTHLKD